MTTTKLLATTAIAAALLLPAGVAHADFFDRLGDKLGINGPKPPEARLRADSHARFAQELTARGVDQGVVAMTLGGLSQALVSGQRAETTSSDVRATATVVPDQRPECRNVTADWTRAGAPRGVTYQGTMCYDQKARGWYTANGTMSGTMVAAAAPPPPPQVAKPAPPPPPVERKPAQVKLEKQLDEVMTVTKAGSVRPDASTEFPAIASLKPGQTVTVVGKVAGKDWLAVQVNGRTGYVLASSLAPVDQAAASSTPAIAAPSTAPGNPNIITSPPRPAAVEEDRRPVQTPPSPPPAAAAVQVPVAPAAPQRAPEPPVAAPAPVSAPVASPAPAAAPPAAPAVPEAPAKPKVKSDL